MTGCLRRCDPGLAADKVTGKQSFDEHNYTYALFIILFHTYVTGSAQVCLLFNKLLCRNKYVAETINHTTDTFVRS